uniref:HCO3_cotransp domain-containing protein n=1 Tax=Macrostomum lignano TaxID=282301 RepID=A0A1I8JRL2_9PLAT
CSLNGVQKRHVAIARLSTPVNLGRSSEGKGTRATSNWAGRSPPSWLTASSGRKLLLAETESEFKEMLQGHAHELGEEQKNLQAEDWPICNGIRADLKRRLSHYLSDFIDAVHRVILSQCIGGVTFALFGGQPLIIMLTTAPLRCTLAPALLNCMASEANQNHGLDFFAFFGWVGVFNAALLLLYAVLDLSKLMRCTEEIFAMFISVAFTISTPTTVDGNGGAETNGGKLDFPARTSGGPNLTLDSQSALNGSSSVGQKQQNCQRDVSILFLLLCIGTVFLSMYLLNFTKTPYLNRAKRELMADFSLPVSVLAMSFVGTYLFRNVQPAANLIARRWLEKFSCLPYIQLEFVDCQTPARPGHSGRFRFWAIPLSMLFFMEQNISSAMVNCPANKLRKGSAYQPGPLDRGADERRHVLFRLALGARALPHSPLHVKALADLEERIDLGQHRRSSPRDPITGVVSNVLIGLSLLMCPVPPQLHPGPLLDGLFVCMAITALFDNQLFERILLLFTEQAAYPPSHYLRRVPQRKVHIFTCLQLLQLFVLCALGFNSIAYAKLGFPSYPVFADAC